ncbi:uncharacterized protein LY89DRAFT_687345 [Mollisia scopiformis]|uniref:DUF6924 domain-containing protein n=1 Tax=Mollisia scopiformis TaxID=149040 RepID=A0A194X259_MOLSC|nr:uncharacterized protein LY89DRAFT_687345 [Mollisia scopiformis]KUJ14089.1 hypothetical protein LY89DRAFT_687345 [Mollisia scopiformis]
MIDLTLPQTNDPAINQRLLHECTSLNQAVVYIHAELSPTEIEEVVRACNEGTEETHDDDTVVLSPKHDFVGQPLQASYDYHIKNIVPEDKYDQGNYVAVVDKDWKEKGVIQVTIVDGHDQEDEEDEEIKAGIDKLRCPASETGIQIVNLQIANIDWEEMKEGSMEI